MKTHFFLTGLLLILIGVVTNATAENKAGTFNLSPMVGGYIFEGNQDIKNDATPGLGLGYNIDQTWGLEGMFNFINTDSGEEGALDVYTYRLDALHHFMPDKKFTPYIATGIGGITFDPEEGKKDDDFLANYGLGLKYFINEVVALRVDARHIISFDETYNNFIYTFGFTLLLGGEKKAVPSQDKDNDDDGVLDYLDKCPDTPKEIPVDKTGCPFDNDGDGVLDYLDKCPDTPKEIPVDKTGCPFDNDDDGVLDYLDKCPDTPTEIPVDKTGCPFDNDGDGVFNYLDICPDTPKEAKVDNRGCWVLQGVMFDTGNAEIKSVSNAVIDNIVLILKKNPLLKIEIGGHTDSKGSKNYNKRLSENRAKAVKSYFVSKGIESSRLTAKGFWFSQPAASNDTPEGRALNRRVQLNPMH